MRTPTYTKDGKYRIVSRPAGQWVCQEHIGGGSREHDPWRDTHRDTTRSEALRQLSARGQIDD